MVEYKIVQGENQWMVSDSKSEYGKDLLMRTFDFAILVLKVVKTLPSGRDVDVVKYQITKSGTSVGANYEESQGSSSKKDFYNRIKIVYREARESHYWSRIIHRMKWGNSELVDKLLDESLQLKKIFGSIRQKLRESNI